MNVRRIGQAALVSCFSLVHGVAFAQSRLPAFRFDPGSVFRVVDLLPAGPVQSGQSGAIAIVNDPNGPDLAIFDIDGLAANTTFTIVMAQSPAPNALPTYLLSEFTTNDSGSAHVVLTTEIVNAYLGANPGRDLDLDGIPDGPAAGAVANGAITISLDFFRVYAADGNANVFGVSADDLSGAIVLTSERIPDSADF